MMALERSVLSDAELTLALMEHYGLRANAVKKLALGTANCYRITSDGREYFLKEFQSDFSRTAVDREAAVTEYLRMAGIPVARIYPTVDGSLCFEHRGHLICLEEYIEGMSYGYDRLPQAFLSKVAALLGRLHTAMKPLDIPEGMGREWLATFSAESLAAQYHILEDKAFRSGDVYAERIVDDMRYKAALAARCSEYMKYFTDITYLPTHGDYQACQLIWNGDVIAAVTDFSEAAKLPAVWEIMRSFAQSSIKCRNTATIDVFDLLKYVETYSKYASLTQNDLAAMPYVYLFQLARSKIWLWPVPRRII